MSSFPAETIVQVGNFPITNTLLHTLLVDTVLIGGTFFVTKHLRMIPQGIQNAVEMLFEAMYNLTESLSKNATKNIFPFVMSFFLFILVANLSSLLPGFGTVGFFEKSQNKTHQSAVQKQATQKEEPQHFVPLLRGATSDLNVTLALAIVSVIATHVLSIQITGFKDYISRYISLNPINLYVGMLELVAELTKIVSLSFRLFGNIFAGEVALTTVSKIFAFVFPLPFLLLESIVGVVQALVFSILTLVFMALLTTPHHAGAQHKEVRQS